MPTFTKLLWALSPNLKQEFRVTLGTLSLLQFSTKTKKHYFILIAQHHSKVMDKTRILTPKLGQKITPTKFGAMSRPVWIRQSDFWSRGPPPNPRSGKKSEKMAENFRTGKKIVDLRTDFSNLTSDTEQKGFERRRWKSSLALDHEFGFLRYPSSFLTPTF